MGTTRDTVGVDRREWENEQSSDEALCLKPMYWI